MAGVVRPVSADDPNMTRIKKRVGCVTIVAALLAGGVGPAVSHAAPPHEVRVQPEAVSGTWQTIVPVVIASYQPSSPDPTTGTYQGADSTLWQGTWTGVTHYAIRGTANLVSGAGSGTLQETFAGRSSGDGNGTLSFDETYTLDAAGHIVIEARIVDATGDFTGARGRLTFDGTEVGAVTGSGTYRGRWSHPRR